MSDHSLFLLAEEYRTIAGLLSCVTEELKGIVLERDRLHRMATETLSFVDGVCGPDPTDGNMGWVYRHTRAALDGCSPDVQGGTSGTTYRVSLLDLKTCQFLPVWTGLTRSEVGKTIQKAVDRGYDTVNCLVEREDKNG